MPADVPLQLSFLVGTRWEAVRAHHIITCFDRHVAGGMGYRRGDEFALALDLELLHLTTKPPVACLFQDSFESS
jgi:hypothetical protein